MKINEINSTYSNINLEMNQSISGYWRLMMNGRLLIDDPAEEDFYDQEMAEDIFNEWIEENMTDGIMPAINEAIGIGFDMTMAEVRDMSVLFRECTDFIKEND